ncbi:hypothetical protein PIROE2DRAFT_2535, partial [Piromyces sp. E2]
NYLDINSHLNLKDIKNTEYIYSTIADVKTKSFYTFEQCIFDSLSIYAGLTASLSSKAIFKNCTITNSYFHKGFIDLDSLGEFTGFYVNVTNSIFKNNRSYNGVIVNSQDISSTSSANLNFMDSIFENNTAINYGGIVYSNNLNTNRFVNFENCEFINNNAFLGDISFCLTKESEPQFSNKDDLRKIKGNFVTNPTEIRISSDSVKSVSLFSGDTLNEKINCNLFDDYGNICKLNSDVSLLTHDELIFFNIGIIDSYKAEVVGQFVSYCWKNNCTFPSIKVVGEPGNYKLGLTLFTFGPFDKFLENSVYVNLTIKPCAEEEGYIHQITEKTKFKSCYFPTCNPGCNSGECININTCNCANTPYTGLYCNEYYIVERNNIIDWIVI